jgi:hypothetical protein
VRCPRLRIRCSLAIAIIASILAARPNKWTGTIAFVLGVIAF